VPEVIDSAGDAPPAKKPAKDATLVKKAGKGGPPERECRVYVPGAGITVSVPCAK
jgi:hypothetical protein